MPRHRGYFRVVKQGGNVLVYAQHPDAKQAFWGWGSDRNSEEMSFYGREYARDYHDPDQGQWVFTLSPDAVALMIRNIENHIDDPHYYSGNDVAVGKELLEKLKKTKGKKKR